MWQCKCLAWNNARRPLCWLCGHWRPGMERQPAGEWLAKRRRIEVIKCKWMIGLVILLAMAVLLAGSVAWAGEPPPEFATASAGDEGTPWYASCPGAPPTARPWPTQPKPTCRPTPTVIYPPTLTSWPTQPPFELPTATVLPLETATATVMATPNLTKPPPTATFRPTVERPTHTPTATETSENSPLPTPTTTSESSPLNTP